MKKGLKAILIIISVLAILVLLSFIFFLVDSSRAKNGEKPMFCVAIPGAYLDGGTKEYYGLGYKVICFSRLSGYKEVKIGSLAMQYNDFEKEIADFENKVEVDNNGSLENYTKIIKVNGKLYYDTERLSTQDFRCGTLDGYITSVVDSDTVPEKDNQANFTGANGYQYALSTTLEIPMDDGWHVFEMITADNVHKCTLKREKLSEANLKSDKADVNVLIKFNGILYGRSGKMIDYAGNVDKSIGTIDFITEEDYVPLLDGETNQKEFLNAKVLEANDEVLYINNGTVILFEVIER